MWETLEWALRLLVLTLGALLMGSGLAGTPFVVALLLSATGADGLAEAFAAIWRAESGVWLQLVAFLAGAIIIFFAARPIPGFRTRPGVFLAAALGEPLMDFFHRYHGAAALILALICFYRISSFVLNILNPFYLDLGFTLAEVGEVRALFGLAASLSGLFAGGLAVARLGLMPALVIGAFSGPISNLALIWLATRGDDLPALFAVIGISNIASGFAGTCLIAYISSLTSEGFTATQYALFTSLFALPARVVAALSGRMVEGAAQWAESGGPPAALRGLFSDLPPQSFSDAMEKSGVSPEALGAGYVSYFLYGALLGLVGISLALAVAAREKKRATPPNLHTA